MAESRLIPLTDTGAPNFTKMMPVKFLTTIKTLGFPPRPCKNQDCTVNYELNSGSNSPAWNKLSEEWEGEISSNDLECDRYYTLKIKATRGTGEKSSNHQFYINCNPKLVVEPAEKRVSLGGITSDTEAFTVTMYDFRPRKYSLKMEDTDGNAHDILSPDAQWLEFGCDGCTGKPKEISGIKTWSDDDHDGVPDIGERMKERAPSYKVMLRSGVAATRAGMYTITITATKEDTGETREAQAAVIVTAEGLNEFALWQLAVLFSLSALVFSAWSRKSA